MISRVIDWSIRHRSTVFALALAWALTGAWVVAHTPMDAVPDLSENQVIVFADWPGHGPLEIDAHLTQPLSNRLRGLPGATSVRGSSDVGTSTLYIIFEDGIEFREARRRVQEALEGGLAGLPENTAPRLAAEGIPTGQIYWYTVEGGGLDLSQLRDLQDLVVAPQLRSVAGVAEVASVGGFVAEYHVEIDPHHLSASGLSLADVSSALSQVDEAAGGHVIHKANAEFLVQVRSQNGTESSSNVDRGGIRVLEELLVPRSDGRSVRLGDVAQVGIGPAARRGMFERDGSESVAGIVHLRYGHNPLEVTRLLRAKIREVARSLPEGVRLVPCYDRTPLILGAVSTVSQTLLESLLVTTLCVLLILRHFRTSFVIALTLPLAVLAAFLGMQCLRLAGLADVQTNIMSLAGIVVSIGVLVDSSIVIAENVLHRLHERFGDGPVVGDVRETVAAACKTVGPPAFFAIAIMLISFLPVFALEGIDGKMYRPLAWTKSLALVGVAVLSITLVPALCTVFVRGRMRPESASVFVRTVIGVYRPVLNSLFDRPWPLAIVLALTFVLAAAATGYDWVLRLMCAGCIAGLVLALRGWRQWLPASLLVLVASLVADGTVTPIARELRLPLDEGMVMDMPITVPRASIAQSADDLKARNMVLCRFPEVHMVSGKAGRAETPFDPAPLDMIETMVEFRPRGLWPRRRLLQPDAEAHARNVLQALVAAELIEPPSSADGVGSEVVEHGLPRFDAVTREVCWQRTQSFLSELSRDCSAALARALVARLQRSGELTRAVGEAEANALAATISVSDARLLAMSPTDITVAPLLPALLGRMQERDLLQHGAAQAIASVSAPSLSDRFVGLFGSELVDLEASLAAEVRTLCQARWSAHVASLNNELLHRAAGTWTHIAVDEILSRVPLLDERLVAVRRQILEARYRSAAQGGHHAEGHAGLPPFSRLSIIDPHPRYDSLVRDMTRQFDGTVLLWPHDSRSLIEFGGELDRSVQMPGWTNVWTKPIQNRVDMLATGVNSEVGVRVMGRDLDSVVNASEQIASVLKLLPGASNVVADPIRGKGLIEIVPDANRAAQAGVSLGELQETLHVALAGKVVGHMPQGTIRRPVRLKLAGDLAADEDALRRLPLPSREVIGLPPRAEPSRMTVIPLESAATVRVSEGPATVKSENGWLRNYVRLNVTDRNPSEFVEQARRVVQSQVSLPEGVFVEWTGQYLHSERTLQMLLRIGPVVLLLIGAILYLAYRDVADAALMLLSAPAAMAGGVVCQWILGFPFSIAVAVGYIACFGMAAATGIVMLVYLREAVDRAGGLERLTLPELREAVLRGAVHRLRPKLLTEITTVFSLAPMLWSTGVGAEVIRPMAAPVLGGILVADEVIDLLLPILFYHVRRRRWVRLHGGTPAQDTP